MVRRSVAGRLAALVGRRPVDAGDVRPLAGGGRPTGSDHPRRPGTALARLRPGPAPAGRAGGAAAADRSPPRRRRSRAAHPRSPSHGRTHTRGGTSAATGSGVRSGAACLARFPVASRAGAGPHAVGRSGASRDRSLTRPAPRPRSRVADRHGGQPAPRRRHDPADHRRSGLRDGRVALARRPAAGARAGRRDRDLRRGDDGVAPAAAHHRAGVQRALRRVPPRRLARHPAGGCKRRLVAGLVVGSGVHPGRGRRHGRGARCA